jgi:hypothetical protein
MVTRRLSFLFCHAAESHKDQWATRWQPASWPYTLSVRASLHRNRSAAKNGERARQAYRGALDAEAVLSQAVPASGGRASSALPGQRGVVFTL